MVIRTVPVVIGTKNYDEDGLLCQPSRPPNEPYNKLDGRNSGALHQFLIVYVNQSLRRHHMRIDPETIRQIHC